jgi:hypothetical protein
MVQKKLQDNHGSGEGLDLDSIRTEVIEAFKDPSGKKLAALELNILILGTQSI